MDTKKCTIYLKVEIEGKEAPKKLIDRINGKIADEIVDFMNEEMPIKKAVTDNIKGLDDKINKERQKIETDPVVKALFEQIKQMDEDNKNPTNDELLNIIRLLALSKIGRVLSEEIIGEFIKTIRKEHGEGAKLETIFKALSTSMSITSHLFKDLD